MNEVQQLTIEILEELNEMSPDEIEAIRVEWHSEIKKRDSQKHGRVKDFVDTICDVATNRAKRKIA